MSIQLITATCPNCNATMNVEANRDQAFCTYCGAKIIIHNNNEYIYRHIDEAQLKQAETERMVQMRQMEIAENKRIAAEKARNLKIKLLIGMFGAGILFIIIGFGGGELSGDPDSWIYMFALLGTFLIMGAIYWLIYSIKHGGFDITNFGDKVRVPSGINNFEQMNYASVEAILSGAGFTNIRSVPLNDLTFGILNKPGMVQSISINGHDIIMGGRKFPKDSPVIITYHSMN